MPKPYLILDRDGTLIKEKHYLSDPDQVELIDGVVVGLRRIRELNWGLIVVTNQSGLGRGYFDKAHLEMVNERMMDYLAEEGVSLDGIYYCPHTPDIGCRCRKPKPGLIMQAAKDFDFDPRECVVVGDKICDIELGSRVGAKTILVRSGYGAETEKRQNCNADFIIDHAGSLIEIPPFSYLVASG